MTAAPLPFRLVAATALHRGDRAYQQDQVAIVAHARDEGCVMGIVADGMGGKSGGRKAADQVLMTARQVFDRFVPALDETDQMLRSLVMESHLMIKLTALSAEEEPHSTVAAFVVMPDRSCHVVHAGDSRVYLFRGSELIRRTSDHSFVQRLIDEGKLTEEAAATHPQSNLLTGCLGTEADPPVTPWHIDELEPGDTVIACSDGLWHYFTPRELGAILNALLPREAGEMLVTKARQRARGGGDNLSLAIIRVEGMK